MKVLRRVGMKLRHRDLIAASTIVVVALIGLQSGVLRPVGRPAVSVDAQGAAARITSDTLGSVLDKLQAIARDHGGTRRTGGLGDAATVSYLEEALRAFGYSVGEDGFDTPVFADGSADALSVADPTAPSFTSGRDFGPLMFSPAGTVEGRLIDLGWDPTTVASDGRGCAPADFASVPAGSIVLARPGGCLRRTVVLNAQSAGAVALVTAIPRAAAGQVRRSTLVDPDGITIPAVAADRAVGDALAAAARSGARVRLTTSGGTAATRVRSVLADLPGADPSRVIMVGSHLDSSLDGPGIDDNGTGIAAVLGLARALAGTTPPVTVRFAFWAAEESGLHGSSHYVENLEGGPTVVAYLNADMLGSPNGFRGIYDDAQAAVGSAAIRDLFERDLTGAALRWKTEDLFGSSDHAPFEQVGIPTGGLFSGAAEVIGPQDAATFGRTAGAFADPCYHLACDTRSNVDAGQMLELARSFARVTLELAASPPR